MALSKTFSRRGRKDKDAESSRTLRHGVSKLQISAPVELISTTNMLSFTAPSLPLSASSISPSPTSVFSPRSTTSSISDIESSSPPPTPKVSPNSLSSYISPAPIPPPMSPARTRSIRSSRSSTCSSSSTSTSSNIPQRSLSTGNIASASRPQRKSQGPPPRTSMHRAAIRASNPFGAELAKVSELAEEYSGLNMEDLDEEYMISHGLQKFSCDDYLQEIGLGGVYDNELPRLSPGWI